MPASANQTTSPPQIIAYVFPNFPDDRPLRATDIDAAKLTRINYAFALIHNGQVVEGGPRDAVNLRLLHSLKQQQPSLEILVSVGGWLGSGGFSDAALTPASRRRFAASALAFVERYDLDGLDLDWEYPGLPGAGHRFRQEDGAHFNLLLRELHARLDERAQRLHRPQRLTLAAGASREYLTHTDLGAVASLLDTVNLMTYDYYEPGSDDPSLTGNHAPLFADPADPAHASAAASVSAFEQAGLPAAKIVLGVPFYGHAWAEVPAKNHGLFQRGHHAEGLHTTYPDVEHLLHADFTRYWDEASQVPFAYNAASRQFITYEDPQSLARKCRFVREQRLGGIMFWQLLADPSGVLLSTIHDQLTVPSSKAPVSARKAQP